MSQTSNKSKMTVTRDSENSSDKLLKNKNDNELLNDDQQNPASYQISPQLADKGAGVKIGTRCLWDAEADDYAHGNFINESIFCVACVYAVFFY
ncbi:Similar to dynlt2b: Dynein light chain Tctex-type protein 2B (Danio rerio) [Cotesia congregata]|uniref:Similar to dynlt2b: Dynein light chain Tctex-type protein 2B (Danio rerio) n=1 Tax=Cotesia congregata TaxID=51543 RepID=A0A8J2MS11_COTCN|nr:Similar to dynlt2b: Dynein light chain Tctex-type protein 2B (Danio rerio) [Cotesia congregata]